MATFPSVSNALSAAAEMTKAPIGEVNLCVGIGYGRILQLDDDLFGDEVNVAYKLGEDVAGPGEVLVSEAAAMKTTVKLDGPQWTEIGRTTLTYYRLNTCSEIASVPSSHTSQ